MTTRDRLRNILLDQKPPGVKMDEGRLNRLLGLDDPDATDVDWGEVQDELGYSSLQALAFVKALNQEFGKNLTAEDLLTAKGAQGFLSLLD